MEVEVDDAAVRNLVRQRLSESGTIQTLEEKFRMGYAVAVDSIETNSECPSIEHFPFADAAPEEIIALQSIYRFLSENHLMKTLSCLKSEANVPVKEENSRKLLALIPKGDAAKATAAKKTDRREFETPVEPSVEISRREFQKNKFIIKVSDL